MTATMYRMYEYPAGRVFFITQHEFEEKYLNKQADPHLLRWPILWHDLRQSGQNDP